jgi:hypothetical protein
VLWDTTSCRNAAPLTLSLGHATQAVSLSYRLTLPTYVVDLKSLEAIRLICCHVLSALLTASCVQAVRSRTTSWHALTQWTFVSFSKTVRPQLPS